MLITILLFVQIIANAAFVYTPTISATSLGRVNNNNNNKYVLLHSTDIDDDEASYNDASNVENQPSQKSSNGLFSRRGILKSLIGGTISMAATDLLLNTAITTVSNNPLTAGLSTYSNIRFEV